MLLAGGGDRGQAQVGMPQNVKLQERAARLSLAVGVALLGLKFLAYFLTGSSAIFSDALESIVNVVAASFAVWAIHLSNRPPDREHPYGHGKVEFLSAGFEGGMIMVAAVVIVVEAVRTIFRRPTYEALGIGIALMATALLVNGALGLYLVRTGKKQQSPALEADGQHLLSDALTSLAALVALALVKLFGWRYADPVGAIFIALYIAGMGLRLVKRSTAGLMDEQDEEDRRTLEGILQRHIGPEGAQPRICSYHKLRHRHSGPYHWVDFHIMLPADWSIDRGHRVASAIEYEIERTLGKGNATAHIEPCAREGCGNCQSAQ